MGMPGLSPGQQAIGSGTPNPMDNPLAAMLMSIQNGGAPPSMPPGNSLGKAPAMDGQGTQTNAPPSRLQKMLPLVHLVALWSLLAYFVVYVEPRAHGDLENDISGLSGILTRWAALAKRRPQAEMIQGWGVAVVVRLLHIYNLNILVC